MNDMAQAPDVLTAILASRNVGKMLEEKQRGTIAIRVLQEYQIDKTSMGEWLALMKKGVELAKLVKSQKNTPFPNCSNVKYPLVTSAALQFNARAYPAIIQPDKVVSTKVWGKDPSGRKAARAERVSEHMNWQLLAEDLEWEAEMDKLMIQLPIVGFMVKKVWHDGTRKRYRTIEPGKFIVNNRVKTLNDAPRASEILELYPDEITTRERSGMYLPSPREESTSDDKLAPETFIEQHTRIDLDGDGYAEPYIAIVHEKSQKLVRIIADFEEKDVVRDASGKVRSIIRGSYFVDYHFLPSLDGGFAGTGMGLLLGDMSETINTIINMMIDSGNRASQGGGFLGNEFSMKKSDLGFQPGEWKTINTSGSALRDSIVETTYPGPDATLFQMLGLLIDAGREIASVQDVLTGDTGTSQMTATTTMALIEQGLTVFTAAYQRIYRSLKKEMKLIQKINAATVSAEEYNMFHDGEEQYDPAADYAAADMDIQPVSDPRAVTKMQMTATTTMALIEQGLTVFTAAYQRIYRSLKKEMKLIQKINAATVSAEEYNMFHDGEEQYDPAADYAAADMDIQPVSDPRAVTKMQMMAKAQIVKEMANEGLVDRNVASARILEAAAVPNREELAPKPDPMQDLAMKREQAELMITLTKVESEIAKASKMRAETMETLSEVDLKNIDAVIKRLEATQNDLETALAGSPDSMAGRPNNANNAQGLGIAGPGQTPSPFG